MECVWHILETDLLIHYIRAEKLNMEHNLSGYANNLAIGFKYLNDLESPLKKSNEKEIGYNI